MATVDIVAEEQRYEPDVEDEAETDDSYPFDEYDISSSPNDFNTKTLVDFIDSGVVIIPSFQRNYVWDIKKASRLIESLLVGLPVPQIFLYEQDRNKFLVIDGQQRLMSIYYFVKGRFPRKEMLPELRLSYAGQSSVPARVLADDKYFQDFQLNLPEPTPGKVNKFHRHRYSNLNEGYQTSFDLRTIRNILVRQIRPQGDDAMYEIFNRLNSGGVNLTPQEIRRCIYDSKFYEMLYETNTTEAWRSLVGERMPDIHMKDVEILLRGFAMLIDGDTYRPSLVKFLNRFSEKAKSFDASQLEKLRALLQSFLESCQGLPGTAFHSAQGKFSPMIFEAVFVAACRDAYQSGLPIQGKLNAKTLEALKEDTEFREATQTKTADPSNVKTRLARAHEILAVA